MSVENEKSENEAVSQVKDMIAGTMAGMVAKVIEYPFDTLKTLFQSTESITSNKVTGIQLFKRLLYNEGGILRIYRGLSAPLFGSMFENLIIFWTYGMAERFLMQRKINKTDKLNTFEVGLAGAFSGLGTTIWLTPVEYIKCQMQHSETGKLYKNTFDCFKQIIRYNPLKLTNGLMATFYRETPGGLIYFVSYKTCLNLLNGKNNIKDPKPYMVMLSGACAGITFWISIYPFDLAKTKQQTIESDKTIVKILINRFKLYGFKGLYSGLNVTIPRAILSNACIFTTYEYSKKFLNKIY